MENSNDLSSYVLKMEEAIASLKEKADVVPDEIKKELPYSVDDLMSKMRYLVEFAKRFAFNQVSREEFSKANECIDYIEKVLRFHKRME